MHRLRLITAVVVMFFTTACVTQNQQNVSSPQGISEATHLFDANSPHYPSIQENSVKVFLYKPSTIFSVVGTINARGLSYSYSDPFETLLTLGTSGRHVATEQEDQQLAMNALIREAASMGANGVIIAQQGQYPSGPNATERRISAIAIHF